MPAIQHGNWQQIDEPQVNGDHSHEEDEILQAAIDLLAGNLSDFQRPAQFADRPPLADYLTKGVDHQTKYSAGPLHSNARSFQKGNVPQFGRRALNADQADPVLIPKTVRRSEEHTYELQSLMRNSYAVFCLKKKKFNQTQ